MSNWFEVDKIGLSALVEAHGKHRLVMELIANAWDEDGVTQVTVELRPVQGEPVVEVTVRDDAPEGFRDLSHAWTLFASSGKKNKAEKRGRFNLGEKLVLALCSEARIKSTTGTVHFTRKHGRTLSRTNKSERGTEFQGAMRMTREELDVTMRELRRLLAPAGIETVVRRVTVDGGGLAEEYTLERRAPFATFEAALATVLADRDGFLRPTERITTVELFAGDDEGWIFEMGIPVVEIGGPWNVNILQKVPLNKDRDNVPPAYLHRLRGLALDHGHAKLDVTAAQASWVSKALEVAAPDTVSSVLDLRFGKDRVSYDPSDPEANKRAVAEGYTVVPGGALSKEAWANVREAKAILPAGKVTPTQHPRFSEGGVDTEVPRTKWTEAQNIVERAYKAIGEALLHERTGLSIRIVNDKWNRYPAWYARGGFLTLNVNVLGHRWFEDGAEGLQVKHVDLLLHELGHEFCGDHLSEDYHGALTRLGGQLALLIADDLKLRRLLCRKAAV